MSRSSEIVGLVKANLEDRSICKPATTWTDCESGDLYEAAVAKDGEWITIVRVSLERGEVVMFDIPRNAFRRCINQLGGSL